MCSVTFKRLPAKNIVSGFRATGIIIDLSTAMITPTKRKLPEPEIDHSIIEDQNHSDWITGLLPQMQGTTWLSHNEKKY